MPLRLPHAMDASRRVGKAHSRTSNFAGQPMNHPLRLPFAVVAATVLVATLLAGCASIESTPRPLPGQADGLTYYLPRQDVLITIVKTGGNISSVTIGTTPAYPDLSSRFVLNSGTNLLGKNQADIGIDTSGLLKSSKAVTTSGLSDALKNLAGSMGTFGTMGRQLGADKDACADGTHTFIYRSMEMHDGEAKPCGLTVKMARLHAAASQLPDHEKATGQPQSGLFYRQAEPYLVTVDGSVFASAIVLSPNLAPTRFLPISRTLFADNDSTIEFTDGMPTKYNETRDGELVAVFKLPATVIAAYFGAIGTVFDSFKINSGKESEQLAAEVNLQIAKQKYDACIAAIRAKDDALVAALGCGK